MQLTETIKLYLNREQKDILDKTMHEYITTVNSLVFAAKEGKNISKYTSKDVIATLPSALKNQCINDAKSIIKKYRKACKRAKNITISLPIMKKKCCYINNQNFKIYENMIEFPVIIGNKSKRISIVSSITDRQRKIFSDSKLGTMRIVYKNKSIVAQVIYEIPEPEIKEGIDMGIDLGIKCPAVSYISGGKVKFYGNGRKNKYIRRHFKKMRKRTQKGKNIKALKRINNKEQRIMRDIDHKISHEIIKTAIANKVTKIKLEQLDNIRSTTRTSRKNNPSLHSWSFYRLAEFIEYKGKLAGIKVEFVNPAYTSQRCPKCGQMKHAKDRQYVCKCGFHIHRDLLGAMNICNSTEYVGSSNTRHTA